MCQQRMACTVDTFLENKSWEKEAKIEKKKKPTTSFIHFPLHSIQNWYCNCSDAFAYIYVKRCRKKRMDSVAKKMDIYKPREADRDGESDRQSEGIIYRNGRMKVTTLRLAQMECVW